MKTRITTRVIIYHEGRILLSRNKDAEFWYPGGGGLEEGETLPECAAREVKEEVGQEVEIGDLMYVQEFYGHDKDEKNIELAFLAKLKNKDNYNPCHVDHDNNNPTYVVESRWFTKEEALSGDYVIYPVFMKNFWNDFDNQDTNHRKYWLSK